MSHNNSTAIRKIIHIDMDAFYASIEQRDNPEYRGKPIAVGGSPEGRGGVVATASYEARKFGIRSAMSSKKAVQLCAHVIFVRPRFEVYKGASLKIREIFHRYTDLIEPLSLDEAYLDGRHPRLSTRAHPRSQYESLCHPDVCIPQPPTQRCPPWWAKTIRSIPAGDSRS